MYRHPYSTEFEDRQLRHASFMCLEQLLDSPAYLKQHPGSNSCLPQSTVSGPASALDGEADGVTQGSELLYNACEGLEEWAVRNTLCAIDREANQLCDPEDGLLRGAGLDWGILESYSLLRQQSKMRTLAPATWSILTTALFNHDCATRKKKAANAPTGTGDAEEPSDTASDGPRDPLVVCILFLRFASY